jgi:NAD(P)H-hydrate repair Nnr-like enzyme with NAD(P)H-hydrate dehydratase domain
LLAAGLTPYDAASVGSWLHGAAATLASRGGPLVAGDVAAAVPDVVRLLVWPR